MFVNIFILLIALLNFILMFFYWDIKIAIEYKAIILFFILIIESIFIIYIINKYYTYPIKQIKYHIQKFLVWDKKTKDIIDINISKEENIIYIINFFNQTLSTLSNIKQEFIRWKEIRWEVEIWRELQEKMINKTLIKIPSLNIIAKSRPAREIWWDSYDIINSWDNYYIYIWDATWHWVWAWFIMVMINALIDGFSRIFNDWSKILYETNNVLKPRVKSNLLMTMLLLRWNEKEKKIFMTWAGHEFLLIYSQRDKKCYKIKSWWVALWMTKNIDKLIKENQIRFEENDIIVLYSDGITEAINKSKKDWSEQRFWEERLVQTIESSPNIIWKDYKSAELVFKNITIELSKFMWYKYVQLDDITLVCIQYKTNNWDDNNNWDWELKKEFITEWNWK